MTSTKKIAILLYRYFPYGGLQKDFLEVAKELQSREIKFKVFTRKWEGAVPEGFHLEEIGERGFSNFSKNKNFVKDSFAALKEYDPDLVFGFNKMPGLDLYFAADTCFKKQALNKNPLIKFTRRFKQSIEFEKSVFESSSSTEVFLLNKKQAEDFKEVYQLNPHQMTLIPPGIDLNWSDHEQIEIHNIFKIPPEDKVALFVGSDFSRKGLDRAISSVHSLNTNNIPFSLLVIGKDNFGPYSELVDKLGLNNKIKFLGPRDDVASIMKSSDLLLHPAREEAAGNVIIESLVSHLPVATCRDVGFAEEVKENKGGIVLDEDFDQDKFDKLVLGICENKKLKELEQGMLGLEREEYFFSRFKFIADKVEERINA
tara:strand:- start:1977 stop:3089 length:1113 start_codon:yes stop_codon:yes gene_type:complete